MTWGEGKRKDSSSFITSYYRNLEGLTFQPTDFRPSSTSHSSCGSGPGGSVSPTLTLRFKRERKGGVGEVKRGWEWERTGGMIDRWDN